MIGLQRSEQHKIHASTINMRSLWKQSYVSYIL